MLEIKELNVYYGKLPALRNISLNVDEGEIVSIIGSNGAGKSTLLKTISGLLRPRSGTISFRSKRIDGLDADQVVELGVTHVPEGRRLFPFLSVEDNLKVGNFAKRAASSRNRLLSSVYEIFPLLSSRKRQAAETLSGGEQQMVAIGRGLMSEPSLLMLDEPSQGLAPTIVQKLYETVKATNKKGVTILLVEQNTQYALALASRAYVLENGSITIQGKSEELLSDPYVKKSYLGL